MEAFSSRPETVWEWYNWRRGLIREVKPNPGHYALGELEEMVRDFTLITQNVDNLHRAAGSKNVLELHGNIFRSKCVRCGRPADTENDPDPAAIPRCGQCGGMIRPDVVWFGEMLPSEVIEQACAKSEQADVFLSIGTSGLVHPAAGLPIMAKRRGGTLVEINPDRTPLSDLTDFYFARASGEFLPELIAAIHRKAERGTPPKGIDR